MAANNIVSAKIDEKTGTMTLVVKLQEPAVSSTGKSLNIAVFGGTPDGLSFKGKNVRVNGSAGIPNPEYKPA
jgi:hypothetical protein